MDCYEDCAGDVPAGMLRVLARRRDLGVPFKGETITAITPLGQVVRRVFEHDGRLTGGEA